MSHRQTVISKRELAGRYEVSPLPRKQPLDLAAYGVALDAAMSPSTAVDEAAPQVRPQCDLPPEA